MNGQHRGDNLMQPKGHKFLRYSNLVTGTQPLRHLLACCLGGLFVLGCTLELGALTKGDEDPAPASAKDVETDQAGPEQEQCPGLGDVYKLALRCSCTNYGINHTNAVILVRSRAIGNTHIRGNKVQD